MKLRVLRAAELEAVEAAIWYDEQREGLGDEFLDDLRQSYDHIEREPTRFGRLEGFRGTQEIRRSMLGRFPYVVVFWCRPDEMVVVALSHARRKPLYWLDRLG